MSGLELFVAQFFGEQRDGERAPGQIRVLGQRLEQEGGAWEPFGLLPERS
jgi:hypothetical protein